MQKIILLNLKNISLEEKHNFRKMEFMKKINRIILIVFITIVIALLLGVLLPVLFYKYNVVVTDFESCVTAGNAIMETYPERCMHDGVTYTKVYLNNLNYCQTDLDCIPLPSECHPTSCINKDFENNFKKPEMCTKIFISQAAYSKEDCLCQENVCVNINLGRDSLEE